MKHVDDISEVADKKRIIEPQLLSELSNGFGGGLVA